MAAIPVEPNPATTNASSTIEETGGPPKIKVTVKHNARTGVYTINSTHPLPTPFLVFEHLPKAKQPVAKHYVDGGYPLRDILIYCGTAISTQVWADAIVKATEIGIGAVLDVTATVSDFGDMFMAVGDQLFKLIPQESAVANKAITVAKRATIERAKTRATQILDSAEQNATAITRAATKIKEQLERERNSKLIPPYWAASAGIPVRYRRSQWQLAFDLDYKPAKLAYQYTLDTNITKRRVWDCLPAPALRVMVWVPISTDGHYGINSLVLNEPIVLPHINQSRACSAPGDLPPKIDNYDSWLRLIDSFTRTMNAGITLHDLLGGCNSWPEQVWAFVPPALKKHLRDYGASERLLTTTADIGGTITTVDRNAESAATWGL